LSKCCAAKIFLIHRITSGEKIIKSEHLRNNERNFNKIAPKIYRLLALQTYE